MKKKAIMLAGSLVVLGGLSSIGFSVVSASNGNSPSEASVHQNIDRGNSGQLYQYSTINALMSGQFDGELTLGQLKQHGDVGLGTLNGVNGELTELDGKYYQFDNNGIVNEVSLKEKTPFAVTTKFNAQKTVELSNVPNIATMSNLLLSNMDKKNNFYAFKIHGTFPYLETRSEPKQTKPYTLLTNVLKNESIHKYQNVTGTLVVFYTPNYASTENVIGFHYHFISDDHKAGGHVLDLQLANGTADFDSIKNFDLELPQTALFQSADLTQVKLSDVTSVESAPAGN